MRKFQFRLAKLLEFRQLKEKWAKDAFWEARARRLDGEGAIEGVRVRRSQALQQPVQGLEARQTLDRFMERLDDEESNLQKSLQVLVMEEESARELWLEAKREAEALDKLKERAHEEFKLEVSREEQKAEDEWAATRKAA